MLSFPDLYITVMFFLSLFDCFTSIKSTANNSTCCHCIHITNYFESNDDDPHLILPYTDITVVLV